MCTYSFGIAANIHLIKKKFIKKKIPIIEDACLIFGGKDKDGVYYGNNGDLSVFSFGYEKNS